MNEYISPTAYIGSTFGNAYHSGVDMKIVMEAMTVTYDESKSLFMPQIRAEIKNFERLDNAVNMAIWAKERLDELVKTWQPSENS